MNKQVKLINANTFAGCRWSYFHAMETQRVAEWEKKTHARLINSLRYDASDRAHHTKRRDNAQFEAHRRYHEQALIEIEWLSFMTAN